MTQDDANTPRPPGEQPQGPGVPGGRPDGATHGQEWVAPGQEWVPPTHSPAPQVPPPLSEYPEPGTPPASGPEYGGPQYGGAQSGGPPPHQSFPNYRSWQPGIMPLRPMSFADFLSTPFKAIRFNTPLLLGAPALLALIAIVPSLFLLGSYDFTELVTASGDELDFALLGESLTPSLALGWVVVAAVSILADLIAGAIIAPGVARAVLGEKISIGTAWAQVKLRFGTLIALYLVFFGLTAAIVLVVALPAITIQSTGGFALTVLLFFAAIPLLVYVSILQWIARPLIVLENIGVGAALSRARALLRRRWWWTILIAVVTAVIVGTVTSVLQTVMTYGLTGAAFLFSADWDTVWMFLLIASGITTFVTTTIYQSYFGTLVTLVYVDLRMRHEGFDIELARAAERRAQQNGF